MRGSLWRCSGEQLRPATNDKNLGAELVNRYLSDLRRDVLHNKGFKKYVDVRAEGHPVIAEDVDEAELSDYRHSEDESPTIPREPKSQPGSESRATDPISESATLLLDQSMLPASARAFQREGGATSRARSRTSPPSPSRGVENDLSTAQLRTPVARLFRQQPVPFPVDEVSTNVGYNGYLETRVLTQPVEGSEFFSCHKPWPRSCQVATTLH